MFSAYLSIFHAVLGTFAFKLAHRKVKETELPSFKFNQYLEKIKPQLQEELKIAQANLKEEDAKVNIEKAQAETLDEDEVGDYDDADAFPESTLSDLAQEPTATQKLKQDTNNTPKEDSLIKLDENIAKVTALKQAEDQDLLQNGIFYKNVALLCFIPVAFIIADFIIGWLFTGFPWMYFGYIAVNGPFSAYAPLIGVRGITLLLFISAGAIALTIERKYIYLPIAGLIFLIAIMLQGISYTQNLPAIKVAGVQGNIEQSLKWLPEQVSPTIETYVANTMALFGNYDLIIWPESSIPVYAQQIIPLLTDINIHANATGSPLLIGIQRINRHKESYNSMYLLGQSEDFSALQVYDKRKLVPFGEVIPFEEYTKQLGSIFNFPMSGFSNGKAQQPQLHLLKPDLYFIPAICYESIFPETMATFDTQKTNGIIMLSNDSWFGNTRGPLQHLNIARMRSMEMQKPMIRITNSGITALINEKGQVVTKLEQNKTDVLKTTMTPTKGQTPYMRYMNLPLIIGILCLILIGWYFRRQVIDENKENFKDLIRP